MNKVDWSKWSAIAEILSAIAIVATLLYLAVQTQYLAVQTEQNNEFQRQNNALLEADAGYNLARNRAANSELLKTSPEFASLLVKLAEGDSLTAQDEFQAWGFYVSFIVNWAWEYNEYREGRISESQLPDRIWGALLRGEGPVPTPGLMAVWDEQKQYYDQEFARFIDDEVIPRR